MKYDFLILSLLFMIPGIIIYILREDLRKVIHIMALCSIPFAFTERFFYPSYWEPVFLFNLIDILGFGIEDILFVIGLSAFTSTAYAFFTNRSYHIIGELQTKQVVLKCLTVLGSTFLMIGLILVMDITIIYGSFLIMTIISLIIFIKRKDLLIPGLTGGFLATTVYTLLCLCLTMLLPGVFKLTWHTDQFLNIFIIGIPVEEIIYGFTSGMVSTVFYPFVFNLRFRKNIQ